MDAKAPALVLGVSALVAKNGLRVIRIIVQGIDLDRLS
jgi:hypothetical protein